MGSPTALPSAIRSSLEAEARRVTAMARRLEELRKRLPLPPPEEVERRLEAGAPSSILSLLGTLDCLVNEQLPHLVAVLESAATSISPEEGPGPSPSRPRGKRLGRR